MVFALCTGLNKVKQKTGNETILKPESLAQNRGSPVSEIRVLEPDRHQS